MTEKEIKNKFIDNHLRNFATMLKIDENKLRLYAIEIPIRTNNDGTKYADIVLEIDEHSCPQENKAFILEFKKDKIDYHSAVAQILRYSDLLQKQLYRKNRITPFIIAPEFSEHELKLAKENKVIPVQYCWETGYMKIKTKI